MGADWTDHSPRQARCQQADGGGPCRGQWGDVHHEHQLPVCCPRICRRRAADVFAVRTVPVPVETADSGYQGEKFQQGLGEVCRQVNVEIVKRSEAKRFIVLPKRWIVERTIGWLNRCRRLAKDWECLNHNALAFLRWASVRLMVRKLCQNKL